MSAKEQTDTPRRAWVAISQINGCSLFVEDEERLDADWPGITWKTFVPETELTALQADVRRLVEAMAQDDNLLNLEENTLTCMHRLIANNPSLKPE